MFATSAIAEDEVLFEEQPLVCAQFLWNQVYKYRACHHCLKALETAEENIRRLTGQSNLDLPFPDCCSTVSQEHVQCPHCQVGEAPIIPEEDMLCPDFSCTVIVITIK